MANLPSSSVTPGPPFSAIGVDTFGPWSIVTRKTSGAESNRWAIMFTCLTTRANHIKVDGIHVKLIIHQSLRKKIAIRGNVRKLRSDRGTNFFEATKDLNTEVMQGPVKNFLDQSMIKWILTSLTLPTWKELGKGLYKWRSVSWMFYN